MKNKYIASITGIVNMVVIIIFFLVLPIIMYLSGDPTVSMGIAYLQYIYIGPLLCIFIGFISGIKKDWFMGIVGSLIVSIVITNVIIRKIAFKVFVIPIIVICVGYGLGYIINLIMQRINNKWKS